LKTNIAKQSEKYPNHYLLVHNLHTTKQIKKEKKGRKVFVGWKVRPKQHRGISNTRFFLDIGIPTLGMDVCFPFIFFSLLSLHLCLSTTQESSCLRQELSGDTHYAVVQLEKVVRTPAGWRWYGRMQD